MDLEGCFKQINDWHKLNAKQLYPAFNAAATEQEILEAEQSIGSKFPASVRQAYLIHNGETGDNWGVLDEGMWLSLKNVVALYKRMCRLTNSIDRDPSYPVPEGAFDANRMIPLIDMPRTGDWYFVEPVQADTDESPVIDYSHEDIPGKIHYQSFEELLYKYSEDLLAGRYLVMPDGNPTMVHKDYY